MRKALLVVLILSSVLSWAQGGCTGQKPLNGVTTGGFLKALSNQTIRVCTDSLNPCTLAQVYSDAALSQPIDQTAHPITTDAAGNYQYCAASGSYNEQITSSTGIFSQVNNTPVTIGGNGDVLASGNNKFTGTNRGFFTPNYFYAADSFKMATAMRSKVSWLLGTSSAAPQHHVIIGDSRQGLNPQALQAVAAQYGGINATGFVHFFSNIWGVPTYTIGGSCTATRNDTTSTSTWGIAGSRLDCPSGQTVSIKPTYAHDSVHIWYNQTSGGGSFTWAIDGGGTTTVNTTTAGADALGVVTVTGLDASIAHTVALNVTSGSVRFYGMDFANSTQSGIILHVLQSGSSQASMWNGHMGYAAQFIATVNPASVTFDLGTNDAGASFRTATQFATDITAVVSGAALSSTQAPIVMTQEQRGSSPGVADATVNGLLAQYNQQIISLAQANNWSVFDAANYWPDYLTAYNAGMYLTETPQVHWTNFGALYMLGGLAKNVFAPLADGIDYRNLTPAGRNFQVNYSSSGVLQEQMLYNADHGLNVDLGAGKTAEQPVCWNFRGKNPFVTQFSVCKDTSGNLTVTDSNGFTRFIATGTGTMRLDVGASVLARAANGGTILATLSDSNGKGTFNGGLAAGSSGQWSVDTSGNVSTSGTVTSAGVTASTGTIAAIDPAVSGTVAQFGAGGTGRCFFQNGGNPTTRTKFTCVTSGGANVFNIDPANGVAIGANGSTLGTILTGTATLTYTAIAAQTCQEQPITVTNSSTTNFGAFASPRASLGSTNLSWSASVIVAGTVQVRVCNPTTGSITPSAVAWGVTVNQ